MKKQVKIMHIDSDYQPHCIMVQKGAFIHSKVSLNAAIDLLKSEEFDLILSEPYNKAILKMERNLNQSSLKGDSECVDA